MERKREREGEIDIDTCLSIYDDKTTYLHMCIISCIFISSIYIYIPSGYLTVRHGKSPCLIGKPSISMGHQYHGKLLVITRG